MPPRAEGWAVPLPALSLGYLFLPLLLFFGGWLRLPLALAAISLLGLAAYRSRDLLAERAPVPRRALVAALLLALAWTALSGVAGFGRRNVDWSKHDAVLAGVVEKDWPVVYDMEAPGLEGKRHPLVFYLAYYLPAGAVGKLLGWRAANLALALWTAGGLTLVLLWVARLLEGSARPAVAMILFLLASGLDAVGFLLRAGRLFGLTEHLEWWAGFWQYSANTSLLFWVPHQALGGWLATALLLDGLTCARGERAVGLAPLELAGALFWSPFAALGAAPFALLRILRSPRSLWRGWVSAGAAGVVGGVLVVYYAALRQDRIPSRFEWDRLTGELAAPYFLFVLLEFGIVALLGRPPRSTQRRWIAVWWVAAASLLLIPSYRLGYYNDFVMRASIPALFALWLLVLRQVLDVGVARWRRAGLAILLVIGAVTPATEIARAVTPYRLALPIQTKIAPLPVLHPNPDLAPQYTGPPDALFFRYLARPLPAFPR